MLSFLPLLYLLFDAFFPSSLDFLLVLGLLALLSSLFFSKLLVFESYFYRNLFEFLYKSVLVLVVSISFSFESSFLGLFSPSLSLVACLVILFYSTYWLGWEKLFLFLPLLLLLFLFITFATALLILLINYSSLMLPSLSRSISFKISSNSWLWLPLSYRSIWLIYFLSIRPFPSSSRRLNTSLSCFSLNFVDILVANVINSLYSIEPEPSKSIFLKISNTISYIFYLLKCEYIFSYPFNNSS